MLGVLKVIAEELIPGVSWLWEWSSERWADCERAAGEDSVSRYLVELDSIKALRAPKDDDWQDVLDVEYKRLDNLEQKARVVLGVLSLVIPFATFVPLQLGDMAASWRRVYLTVSASSLAYLIIGALFAIRANRLAPRDYRSPADYVAAVRVTASSRTIEQTALLAAAVHLTMRDAMAERNRFKQNATDYALRALRNGLVCLLLCAVVAVVSKW